jgi:hypothetical protein
LSHVGDEGNDIEVGMDDFLGVTQTMEGILLDAFHQNELGDDIDVRDTFFESLESSSTTPLFGRVQGLISSQLGTTMLPYYLKERYGMSDA